MAYQYKWPPRNVTIDIANQRFLTGLRATAKELGFPAIPYGVEADEEQSRYVIMVPLPVIVMGRRRFDGLVAMFQIIKGRPSNIRLIDPITGLRGTSNRDNSTSGVHPHVSGYEFCQAGSLQDANDFLANGRYAETLGLVMAVAGSSTHRQPGLWLCEHCGRDSDRDSKCHLCLAQVCGGCSNNCSVCSLRVCKTCRATNQSYCRTHTNVTNCAGCKHEADGNTFKKCPSCGNERCGRCLQNRCDNCRKIVCRVCINTWNYRCKACNSDGRKVCSDNRCPEGGQPQPIGNFSRHSRTADGYTSRCKVCIQRSHDETRAEEIRILQESIATTSSSTSGTGITGYAIRLDSTTTTTDSSSSSV